MLILFSLHQSARNYFGGLALATAFLVAQAGVVFAQEAQYRMTFNATWTSETHPTDYPGNPHFSGLVGGTHNSSVSFWEEGVLASLGIKRMAEWGNQTELLDEVQMAIDAGQAGTTVADAPLWDVPGSTSIEFSVSSEFPLVSLVAMIAPSPDWFVGVQGLDLKAGGNWAEELVVDLFPWDAGTDSGTSYNSPDQVTSPPEPILLITGSPFSAGVPIGTLTFTRLFVTDVPGTPTLSASAFPNPFNPQTTIAWELPQAGAMTLEIFDIRGRRVRLRHDGPASAEIGQTAWDGRTDNGRQLNSGQYFYRLRAGGSQRAGKLTLIK